MSDATTISLINVAGALIFAYLAGRMLGWWS